MLYIVLHNQSGRGNLRSRCLGNSGHWTGEAPTKHIIMQNLQNVVLPRAEHRIRFGPHDAKFVCGLRFRGELVLHTTKEVLWLGSWCPRPLERPTRVRILAQGIPTGQSKGRQIAL